MLNCAGSIQSAQSSRHNPVGWLQAIGSDRAQEVSHHPVKQSRCSTGLCMCDVRPYLWCLLGSLREGCEPAQKNLQQPKFPVRPPLFDIGAAQDLRGRRDRSYFLQMRVVMRGSVAFVEVGEKLTWKHGLAWRCDLAWRCRLARRCDPVYSPNGSQ